MSLPAFHLLAMLSGFEIGMIVLAILVFFGATRLPKLARSMGQSVTEFKKGVNEAKDAIATDAETSDPTP